MSGSTRPHFYDFNYYRLTGCSRQHQSDPETADNRYRSGAKLSEICSIIDLYSGLRRFYGHASPGTQSEQANRVIGGTAPADLRRLLPLGTGLSALVVWLSLLEVRRRRRGFALTLTSLRPRQGRAERRQIPLVSPLAPMECSSSAPNPDLSLQRFYPHRGESRE
jgi:hypothetical protein